MVDQNLQIIEVAFTVVTPWTCKNFLRVGVSSLFLCHLDRHKTWNVQSRVTWYLIFSVLEGIEGCVAVASG